MANILIHALLLICLINNQHIHTSHISKFLIIKEFNMGNFYSFVIRFSRKVIYNYYAFNNLVH